MSGAAAPPAGAIPDAIGAPVGEVGADPVPDHLAMRSALASDVRAGDQHGADGAVAVAVDHRDLSVAGGGVPRTLADPHPVGTVLGELQRGEVRGDVRGQIGARIADLVEKLLGHRAPVDHPAGAGVLGDHEAAVRRASTIG